MRPVENRENNKHLSLLTLRIDISLMTSFYQSALWACSSISMVTRDVWQHCISEELLFYSPVIPV